MKQLDKVSVLSTLIGKRKLDGTSLTRVPEEEGETDCDTVPVHECKEKEHVNGSGTEDTKAAERESEGVRRQNRVTVLQ